jgi:hypothetical protein
MSVTGGSQPADALIPAGQGRRLHAGATRPVVKAGPHIGSRLIGMLESELALPSAFPTTRTTTTRKPSTSWPGRSTI